MQDNALLALEIMHRFVETLDRYFGNVFPCGLPGANVGVRAGPDL